jgi:ABC-2 type transport system ATP-binding protein
MEPAVAATDVSKQYGGTVALDGVSLSVAPGELFALIGPNGAGKTTLVRCLTGTATPDAGEVSLLGGPPAAVDRSRIGLLPQSFAPAARLTARELVAYYAGLYEEARDPESVLAAVGLAETETHYERLSGGQKRRACVAAALVNDPEVLFLDEPTAGIDPAGRRALRDVIGELVAAGTTVVLTTHDMAEAERLADRVGMLADGALIAEDTPAELVAAHAPGSTLRVETDADAAVLREAGYDAHRTEDGLLVEGVDPTAVGDVVRTLDERGVAFAALTWREPDLEDAYMALAGEGTEREQTGNATLAGADGGESA